MAKSQNQRSNKKEGTVNSTQMRQPAHQERFSEEQEIAAPTRQHVWASNIGAAQPALRGNEAQLSAGSSVSVSARRECESFSCRTSLRVSDQSPSTSRAASTSMSRSNASRVITEYSNVSERNTQVDAIIGDELNSPEQEQNVPEEELPLAIDRANRPANITDLNERVSQYFEPFNPETKTRRCTRCQENFKGNLSHMKNHLSSKHRAIAQALGLMKRARRKRLDGDEASDDEVNRPPKKLKPININITIRELVEFFLGGNISLNQADRMRKIGIIKREFEAHYQTFNRKKLKEYILRASEQIYKEIGNEVRGKFPSLMFDSASRHGRHVFAASLRFAKEGKLVERTIGVITQHQQQSARNLFNQIVQMLSRVGLTVDDIYSTCTDQGANMLRAAELTKQAQKAVRICRNFSDSPVDRNTDSDDEELIEQIQIEEEENQLIDETVQAEKQVDHEVEQRLELQRLQKELHRAQQYMEQQKLVIQQQQLLIQQKRLQQEQVESHEEQHQEVEVQEIDAQPVFEEYQPEDLQDEEEVETIADVVVEEGTLCSKMVCGAHTCQLAAKDVIKHYQAKISDIRAVVKISKRQEFTELLADAGVPSLHTDVAPRWDSLFLMISDVNKYRDKLQEIALTHHRFEISESTWEFVTEFIQAFTPVHFAMKDFQQADMTISEFFIRWVKMGLEISKVPEGPKHLRSKLLEALNRRKQKFFECDAFVAGLVLDPRIKWSLDPENFFNPALCERGIKQLEKIYEVINIARPLEELEQQIQETHDDVYEEELEDLLGGYQSGLQQQQTSNQLTTLRQKVASFLAGERLPAKQKLNPLQYWFNKRDEEPVIYKVSQVVYGAAFSQVKVERDFSGFALVLTHLRTLLADETLNAILVSKNNLDLLERVKFI